MPFGARCLLGTSLCCPLVLFEGSRCSLLGRGLGNAIGASSVAVGVQLLHHVFVLQRVLLRLVVNTDGGANIAEFGLDLIRVDDSGEISTVDRVALELVTALLSAGLAEGAENLVKLFEAPVVNITNLPR